MKHPEPRGRNWRFRVPDGAMIRFRDENFGEISRTALRDFGDFLVWNRDDIPAYELAVVVDDLAMGVTEVVRGADLLTSTARQILIYRALEAAPPAFFHCPLVVKDGRRLAKRDAALSLRALRARFLVGDVIAQAHIS
jgi:glutamyl-tRNA synthetase